MSSSEQPAAPQMSGSPHRWSGFQLVLTARAACLTARRAGGQQQQEEDARGVTRIASRAACVLQQ